MKKNWHKNAYSSFVLINCRAFYESFEAHFMSVWMVLITKTKIVLDKGSFLRYMKARGCFCYHF